MEGLSQQKIPFTTLGIEAMTFWPVTQKPQPKAPTHTTPPPPHLSYKNTIY